MKILITGGLGYIGSHTCVELINESHEIVIIDNLSNSKEDVLNNLEQITDKKIKLYKCDLKEKEKIEEIFKEHEFDAVIHFAGYKAVGESVEKPLMYYENNLISTINLLRVMKEYDVKKIIFSSTATVYGEPEKSPIDEDFETGRTESTYATTKYMIERILKDLYRSDNSWSIGILRYFNPIGAHESGLIGEDPQGIPNNLMPYIMKVASGKLEVLSIFGDDYETKDGTGVRDYIHVVDLAKGHVKALDKINEKPGVYIYNLGTGKGCSVLDVVNTFERVNNIKLNYKIASRRSGDIAIYYASPEKAKRELGWIAEKSLEDMCLDSWNYERLQTNSRRIAITVIYCEV